MSDYIIHLMIDVETLALSCLYSIVVVFLLTYVYLGIHLFVQVLLSYNEDASISDFHIFFVTSKDIFLAMLDRENAIFS